MPVRVLVVVALMAVGGCAATGKSQRPTSLSARDAALLAKVPEKEDGDFRRVWRHPALREWGYIKWDEDRSRNSPGAPADLLQNLRDELGRLNQAAGAGPNLYLAVTVGGYHRGGIFSRPSADLELVVRDGAGRMLWAATGPVAVNPALTESMADSHSVLIAREVLLRMRRELRLRMTASAAAGGKVRDPQ